ncbi:MAG: DEAD/DEAH box helicase [Acidobacteria bacterium]|nr:DEAD/DEAH box helicase [Acidobacteriota bacterium]
MPADPQYLLRKYQGLFPTWARQKGLDILRQNLLETPRQENGLYRAFAHGTATYEVVAGEQLLDCECPFFPENGFCKHTWALLTAINQAPQGKAEATKFVPTRRANWHDLLHSARLDEEGHAAYRENSAFAEHIIYRLAIPPASIHASIELDLYYQDRKRNGQLSTPKPLRLIRSDVGRLADEIDRAVLSEMLLVLPEHASWSSFYMNDNIRNTYHLAGERLPAILKTLAPTHRLVVGPQYQKESWREVEWTDAKWKVQAKAELADEDWIEVSFAVTNGEDVVDLKKTYFIDGRLVLYDGHKIGEFESPATAAWLRYAVNGEKMNVPRAEWPHVFALMSGMRRPPLWDLPKRLKPNEVRGTPKIRLRLRMDAHVNSAEGTLTFLYDDAPRIVETADYDGDFALAEDASEMIVFDRATHDAARLALRQLHFTPARHAEEDRRVWQIPFHRFVPAVHALVEKGWEVLAEGKPIRNMTWSKVNVSSGIDWFELRATAGFDEQEIDLPALLAALREKSRYIKLGDGSIGLLPEEWIQRYAPIDAVGKEVDGAYRFKLPQAAILDALLEEKENVSTDAAFEKARTRLRGAHGLAPAPQPKGFKGEMRPYQLEGLAWLLFLEETGLGGCLADDMGVGKTIQMLALLELHRQRRKAGEELPPDLVVVPKSLMFNWTAEAKRFTPKLKLLDFTGTTRSKDDIPKRDVILTTYGTLRRDIVEMKDVPFTTVVLDEAQAIKNAASDSAKATRLLSGKHNVVMTGTPVENHLGELWSLFAFLNPGLLGATMLSKTGGLMDPESRDWLRKALRPLILRRTKQQVASDLPDRTEQVLYCELDPAQRRLYTAILSKVRRDLDKKIKESGFNKSKIHVLEALLRLRQVACHPKLVDEHAQNVSAKLETLLEHLDEIVQEGHKALVFSQFTSLLALLKPELDKTGMKYEYLDGQTTDRKTPVEHFQSDPGCPLFLLSLKAGGTGLNLTAADYVFLLDPWWNPAVEAQAIDRTHRIGQTRPVFAYRIVARDTIEERILELQQSKRDLAEAILGQDNSVIGNLRAEDLDYLLS